jgi:hypothetical protein
MASIRPNGQAAWMNLISRSQAAGSREGQAEPSTASFKRVADQHSHKLETCWVDSHRNLSRRNQSIQSHSPRNHRRCTGPSRRARRRRGAASPARVKSCCLSGRSRGKPDDVVRSLERRRANGAAIDSRRHGAREESSVKSGVAAVGGLPAHFGLQVATAPVLSLGEDVHTSILGHALVLD